MTDILMVTWERPEITKRVIRSIKANTKLGTYRLLVMDNNSQPEMQEMLTGLHIAGLIDILRFNDINIGLEPARNQLLHLSNSPLIVTTDSDCIPMRIDPHTGLDWLEKLIDLMTNNPEYAAISSRTQVMIGTGNIYDGHEDENIVEFGHPGGSLRIMLRSAVIDTGGWRDEEKGRGSEEKYICSKLRENGWKTGFAVKVKCLHLFGDRSKNTDRWGYPVDWLPSATGHSDIWHPVLQNGDDPNEIKEYTDV
jgi:GT2 family glycosyltransferase